MKPLMAGVVMALMLIAGALAAQQRQSQPPAAGQSMPEMKACQDVMMQHQQMMDQMRTMDGQLQEQLKTMQSARGEARVEAIARVVTTLAEQRAEMHQRVMSMHEQMMSHMMSHAGQDASAMQQCPMMQHMMKPDGQHPH